MAKSLPAVGRQMSNECQIQKSIDNPPPFSKGGGIYHLNFGFDLTFELCHLTF
jgi:hypothetical protein